MPRALSTRSAVIRFQEIPRALAAVQIPAARARPRQCSAAAQGIGGTHHSRTPRPPHPNPRLHRPRTIVRARQQCAREPSPPSAAGCAGPLERRQQDSSAVPAQPQNHFPLLLAGCPAKYPSQMQRLPSPEKFRPRPSPARAGVSSLSSSSREPLLPVPQHSWSRQILRGARVSQKYSEFEAGVRPPVPRLRRDSRTRWQEIRRKRCWRNPLGSPSCRTRVSRVNPNGDWPGASQTAPRSDLGMC